MKLTIVGCSGSLPGPGSAASCYLVEHDGYRLLLDLGSGAIGPLASIVDVNSVDAVALSHMHVDHCADLGPLYVSRRYHPSGPLGQIPVYGPRGVSKRMNNLYAVEGEESECLCETFDFIEYKPGALTLGPLTVEAVPVTHPVEAFALRISADGHSLLYSGDTAYCDGLVEASRGVELALYEASYLERDDNPPDIHMTGLDAGRAAAAAGVGELVLTHLVPWNPIEEVLSDAHDAGFGGQISLATPGRVIEF